MPVMTDPSTMSATSRIDVAGRLEAIEADLATLATELVPERVPAQVLARVVRALGRIERRAGGARVVLTRAAADAGAWKAQGFRSPEEWAARANGSSTAHARADLKASDQLAGLPAARAAASSGDLSTDAAKAVAEGATADPDAESELLGSARKGDLGETRDKARRARQRADQRSGKAAERMFRRRALRTWLELDGEGRGSWNVPPEYQARFLAALEPYRQEAFRLARAAGRRESSEALMADAMDLLARDTLADLHITDPTAEDATDDATDDANAGTANVGTDDSASTSAPTTERASSHGTTASPAACRDDAVADPHYATDGAGTPAGDARSRDDAVASDDSADSTGSTGATGRACGPTEKRRGAGNRRPPAQLVVHASYDALRRGYAIDGEVCEIPGLGPVPVDFARFLATDCLLKVVLTGTDVTVISSDRRYVPAALRAALDARDTECVVPGCHARHHLERDHWGRDFAKGGPTSLANLARICRYHHFLKTHCGWTLTGGPGHWRFEPP